MVDFPSYEKRLRDETSIEICDNEIRHGYNSLFASKRGLLQDNEEQKAVEKDS